MRKTLVIIRGSFGRQKNFVDKINKYDNGGLGKTQKFFKVVEKDEIKEYYYREETVESFPKLIMGESPKIF